MSTAAPSDPHLRAALEDRYRIERELGVGGMATVYLARDIKHDRRVALKVLKPELGAVLGVERFLSEIRVTANLQHPNLLPLFDSGEANGHLFYVMPYVEGESLRQRIEREKQLPIDDAVHIATAVASALDYAHRQGVIHRDLKPENILLHEGEPLVADFGIALAVSNAGGGRITQTGLSLGTPQYMSPEQATGDRAIDGRTDVYSLGAVTYEMLTGEPPHVGSTSQAIIARVLTEKPRAVRAARPSSPAHVEAAIDLALQKLPADRFATAREFADALSGKVVIATPNVTDAGPPAGPARGRVTRREQMLIAAAVGIAALWLATAIMARRDAQPVSEPVIRFEVETPPQGAPLQVSISPDGRTITAGAQMNGQSVVWSRSLSATQSGPIVGTEGANTAVFWSSDGREIAFEHEGRLKRLPVGGGVARTICDAAGALRGGSWNAKNVIVFSMDGALYRVSAAGGLPLKLNVPSPQASRWEYPAFLPGGEHFLVLARGGELTTRGVYVASLAGGTPTRIGPADSRFAFAQPNQLLSVGEVGGTVGSLYAQTLDLRAMRLTGEAVRIADGLGVNPANGAAGFAVSSTGVLVYRDVGSPKLGQLQWYARNGKVIGKVGEPKPYREFSLSPDGKVAAATVLSGPQTRADLWTFDVASNIPSRFTADSNVSGVLWSPDSRSLTFHTTWDGAIRVKALGASSDSVLFTLRTRMNSAEDYSRDGRTLLVRRPDSLFALPLTGERKPRFLAAIKSIDEVRLSPDSKHVSYGTNQSGKWEVYIASYPALDNRRQVSANGGVQARWRGDGKELYYLAPDGKAMVIAIKPGIRDEFLAPTILFQSPLTTPSGILDEWDVTRDGQRFLFAAPVEQSPAGRGPLEVIVNWPSLLPKK